MHGAFVTDYGPAEAIRYGELPDPVPGPGQVLVRPVAVAVDNVDTLVRSGGWRTPVTFPLVVGRDLVGTRESGELVWTNSAGYGGRPGATAELVAVEEDRLYPLPAGADPVRFVAALHAGATAYGALVDRARLRAGRTRWSSPATPATTRTAWPAGSCCGREDRPVAPPAPLRRPGAHPYGRVRPAGVLGASRRLARTVGAAT